MPPLPHTSQSLATRLNTLSESNKSILQLIQRLAKLDFQPGSTPLDTEEGDVRLELSAEIHETLKHLEEELELLSQEVEDIIQSGTSSGRRKDSSKDGERSRLAVLLARLSEDLKSYAPYISLRESGQLYTNHLIKFTSTVPPRTTNCKT
jgi:protein transport protein SEC20